MIVALKVIYDIILEVNFISRRYERVGIEYSTQQLDHFGIVAGICKHIGLVETIDAIIGPTDRKVSVGEATLAMILNALGFVSRPLYLSPEFFRNKPVDLLIRDGLVADDFNDDCLGRALDAHYEAGLTETFANVAASALSTFGIVYHFVHLDTTTFTLHGQYATDDDDAEAIHITHGNSKDHRPDLKQATLALMCAHQSSFPVWLAALDGNASDKTTFPQIIQDYMAHFKAGSSPYFITDSAGYSEDNVRTWADTIKWVSRPPATIAVVRDLYQQVEPDQMESADQTGYAYAEVGCVYGEINQRWLVVFSDNAYGREMKTLNKHIDREEKQAQKALQVLKNTEFDTPEEALQALATLSTKWRFHNAVIQEIIPACHYAGRGRPKADQKPDRMVYRLNAHLIRDQKAIEIARRTKGKFIIATNETDTDVLPNNNLLQVYKEQGTTVERGFRFLKDPMFFAHSLFLKKPQRIMAMLMIMGLSLLVFALAEHHLRQQLAAQAETIPNQLGKPTQTPTMRRVFQIFEGIDILSVKEHDLQKQIIVNLKPIHIKVITLMGDHIKKFIES